MNDVLPADVVFREACLRSKLVTETQWEHAAKHAKQLLKDADYGEGLKVHKLCDEIARYLIDTEVLTIYQTQQLRAGRTKLTLGPYLVTEFLGQGGMGQVFGAVHEIMGRHCAIKVLPLGKSDDLTRESFAREIRVQAALDCPYLVRAFDAGREGNVHFLVTEYVPGTDLRQLVKENGKLSVQQAASIIAQAAAGLAYAHESGLIHRDIKPANILVTPDGHAKVADVGLAAFSRRPDDDPRAGKIVGTADYLSPEQIRTPTQIGPQSDIYSLGCTLYYACTGKVPFPGGDSRSKCKRHLHQVPWDPRKFSPELPGDFVEIIADMLEKDVAKRTPSATEVVRRLSPFASGQQDDSAWLADLGLNLEEDIVAMGRDTNINTVDASSATSINRSRDWKTASDPGFENLGGESGDGAAANDETAVSSELILPSDADPPPLPSTNLAQHPDSFESAASSSAMPPPLANDFPMVTRRRLIRWTLMALLVGAVVGFTVRHFIELS